MKNLRRLIGITIIFLLISGCSKKSREEIDPTTGMATFFCNALEPDIKTADKKFWALGKSNSLQDFSEAMLLVIEEANTASTLSSEPAKNWLVNLATNGQQLMNLFYSDVNLDRNEWLSRASLWKGSVRQLPNYCN